MKIVRLLTLIMIAMITLALFASCGECKHENAEWETITEPTCLSEGVRQKLCSECQSIIRTGKTEKLAHISATAIEENRVEATCTTDGRYDNVVYCSVCNGEVSRESKVIKAHGHTNASAVEENRVEVTCTIDGHAQHGLYHRIGKPPVGLQIRRGSQRRGSQRDLRLQVGRL